MTVKTFFIGLIASFALPWLAVVAIPYAKMRSVELPQFDEMADGKVGSYQVAKSGRTTDGSLLYGAEGCAQCHSQLSRPTYAGNDLGRDGLAGFNMDPNRGNTMRESNLWDYSNEQFAWIGETRMGPDLGNYGRRLELRAAKANEARAKELGIKADELAQSDRFDIEKEVFQHLYNPRLSNHKSICQSNRGFFTTKPVLGQGTSRALDVTTDNGHAVIPGEKAIKMASYLMGLKRDNDVPFTMNFARNKKKASSK